MAKRKPQPAPSLFKPAPLPIRIYRLHGKLAVAVAIGVVVAVAMHTLEMRGVARALLSSAAEVARSRWQATGLYTTVAATNAGARALYADFGFVEVAAAAAAEGEEEGGSGVRGSLPATLVGRELLLRAEL